MMNQKITEQAVYGPEVCYERG